MSKSDEQTAADAAPLIFSGSDGVEWSVREHPAGSPVANANGPCLIFESESAIRRVRKIPANWRDLEAAELLRVSWSS